MCKGIHAGCHGECSRHRRRQIGVDEGYCRGEHRVTNEQFALRARFGDDGHKGYFAASARSGGYSDKRQHRGRGCTATVVEGRDMLHIVGAEESNRLGGIDGAPTAHGDDAVDAVLVSPGRELLDGDGRWVGFDCGRAYHREPSSAECSLDGIAGWCVRKKRIDEQHNDRHPKTFGFAPDRCDDPRAGDDPGGAEL